MFLFVFLIFLFWALTLTPLQPTNPFDPCYQEIWFCREKHLTGIYDELIYLSYVELLIYLY